MPVVAEIGSTWLTPAAQRTPVNTEAKLLMLTHAFEVWRVQRVSLKTDARNARSRAAIERLGARFDGVLRRHSPAADIGLRDAAFYSIVDDSGPPSARTWSPASSGLRADREGWRDRAPQGSPCGRPRAGAGVGPVDDGPQCRDVASERLPARGRQPGPHPAPLPVDITSTCT